MGRTGQGRAWKGRTNRQVDSCQLDRLTSGQTGLGWRGLENVQKAVLPDPNQELGQPEVDE